MLYSSMSLINIISTKHMYRVVTKPDNLIANISIHSSGEPMVLQVSPDPSLFVYTYNRSRRVTSRHLDAVV